MAQENMMSVEFTPEQITKMETAIQMMAEVLAGKGRSLTPKERQGYGRVKYEKEVWVSKVNTHLESSPATAPEYLDKAEFKRDFVAHTLINKWADAVEKQFELLEDTNRLLGYDLDESSLMYYRHISSSARNNAPGARTIYEDLKQQFPGGGGKKAPVQ